MEWEEGRKILEGLPWDRLRGFSFHGLWVGPLVFGLPKLMDGLLKALEVANKWLDFMDRLKKRGDGDI